MADSAELPPQPEENVADVPRTAWKKILIGVSACTFLIVLAIGIPKGVSHLNQVRRSEEQAKEQAITAQLDAALASAELSAGEYDFNSAINSLEQLEEQVVDQGYLEIEDRYWARLGDLRTRKQGYDDKRRKGWAVFEDRFISPNEKASILADRKRIKAQRRAERKRIEDQKHAEAMRRAESERRLAKAKLATSHYISAREEHRKAPDQVEQGLWKRASDDSGATSLEDRGVLTIAYLQNFPDGQHVRAARYIRDLAIERLWANRVLALAERWHLLDDEIRNNVQIINRVFRRSDAWMYKQQLEELTQVNIKYHQKSKQVSRELDSIGAGGFVLTMPTTDNLDAIMAFCRRNRDAMRYKRWHDAWVEKSLPAAKRVRVGGAKEKRATAKEATEWSESEKAWAELPFLDSAIVMARFVVMFPKGAHADEARERIALAIEMDWCAQVFLKLRTIRGNRKIAEECQRVATDTDDPVTRAVRLRNSTELLEKARNLIGDLQAMGFAGDLDMRLPHEKSNLTEIVLFFREFKLPGRYSEWEERRLIEIFLATIE